MTQPLSGDFSQMSMFVFQGVCDARNTAKLAHRLMQDGCVMMITKSLGGTGVPGQGVEGPGLSGISVLGKSVPGASGEGKVLVRPQPQPTEKS